MSGGPVGPGGGKYSIIEDVAFKEYFKKKRSRGQTILDICSFAYVCGPCRAHRWDIFNYRGCCVQRIFSKADFAHNIIYNWAGPTDKSNTAYIHDCKSKLTILLLNFAFPGQRHWVQQYQNQNTEGRKKAKLCFYTRFSWPQRSIKPQSQRRKTDRVELKASSQVLRGDLAKMCQIGSFFPVCPTRGSQSSHSVFLQPNTHTHTLCVILWHADNMHLHTLYFFFLDMFKCVRAAHAIQKVPQQDNRTGR